MEHHWTQQVVFLAKLNQRFPVLVGFSTYQEIVASNRIGMLAAGSAELSHGAGTCNSIKSNDQGGYNKKSCRQDILVIPGRRLYYIHLFL